MNITKTLGLILVYITAFAYFGECTVTPDAGLLPTEASCEQASLAAQPAPQAAETAQAAAAKPAPAQAVKPAAAQAARPAYEKKETYFALPAVAGGKIDLAAYAGRPVMFMLFTENCPYCRKAAPALEKLYKAYGPKGLTVLGICIQDDAEAAKNFAADRGVTFPLAYAGRDVYRQYRAQGVPYIFLLDARHEPVTVWPGYDQSFDTEMAQAVEKELAKI